MGRAAKPGAAKAAPPPQPQSRLPRVSGRRSTSIFFPASLLILAAGAASAAYVYELNWEVIASWSFYILQFCAFSTWALFVITWCLPTLFLILSPVQNLKAKYDAEWALVTGASSGIGRAVAERLADQGLSVVLVALDDSLLHDTYSDLSAQFPEVKFRKVGVDLSLSDGSYMGPIIRETEDIHVSLLFNNAGYMVTGFFRQTEVDKFVHNIECNSMSAIRVTHHFFGKMVAAKRKGAICFTSSASAFLPSPFATTYAATKAFLSAFAASLAIEAKYYKVDVCAIHPSPVRSRFLDKAAKLDSLDFAMRFSCTPESLPNAMFAALGRGVWRDVGGFSLVARFVTKLMDYAFLSGVFAANAHNSPDWKRYAAEP